MPTFPTLITANPSSTMPAFGRLGPVQVGSSIYLFLVKVVAIGVPPFATSVLNCYKSTDAGTTWNQVGGDSVSVGNNPSAVDVVPNVVAGKIYIITTTGNFGTNKFLQVLGFDTATDTFDGGIITTNQYKGSAGGLAEICGCYRVSDNSLIISAVFSNTGGAPSDTRTAYFVYNIVAQTWGAWIPCGFIGVSTDDWGVAGVVNGVGGVHFIFYNNQQNQVWQQFLSDGNVLGTFQMVVDATGAGGIFGAIGTASNGNTVAVSVPLSDSQTVEVFTGATANPIVFAQTNYVATGGIGALANAPPIAETSTDSYLLLALAIPAELAYSKNAAAEVALDNTIGYFGGKIQALTTYLWGAFSQDANGNFNFFGFSAPAPPATGGLVRLVVPQPVNLPDPKILCNFSQPKLCGDELDCRNYTIQGTKGRFGTFK